MSLSLRYYLKFNVDIVNLIRESFKWCIVELTFLLNEWKAWHSLTLYCSLKLICTHKLHVLLVHDIFSNLGHRLIYIYIYIYILHKLK